MPFLNYRNNKVCLKSFLSFSEIYEPLQNAFSFSFLYYLRVSLSQAGDCLFFQAELNTNEIHDVVQVN